jgi:hypothetical protein
MLETLMVKLGHKQGEKLLFFIEVPKEDDILFHHLDVCSGGAVFGQVFSKP